MVLIKKQFESWRSGKLQRISTNYFLAKNETVLNKYPLDLAILCLKGYYFVRAELCVLGKKHHK